MPRFRVAVPLMMLVVAAAPDTARGHAWGCCWSRVPYHHQPGWSGFIPNRNGWRVGYESTTPMASAPATQRPRPFNRAAARAALESLNAGAPVRVSRLVQPPVNPPRSTKASVAAKPDTRQRDAARRVGVALGRGDKAFEKGDYAEARSEYLRCIAFSDDDAGVQIALGLADYALGNYADAAKAVRAGVARAPHLAGSAFRLKDAYGLPADFRAHRAGLATHLKKHPHDIDAQFLFGFICYFSDQRQDGLRLFESYLADAGRDQGVDAFISAATAIQSRDVARSGTTRN